MKDTIIVGVVLLVAGAGAALWLVRQNAARQAMAAAEEARAQRAAQEQVSEALKGLQEQGGGVAVQEQGKLVLSPPAGGFTLTTSRPVHLDINTSVADGRATTRTTVTFQDEQPVLLTRAAFGRIEPGMTYERVGAVLGGEAAKGRMGQLYSGALILRQGDRQIELTFENGRVTHKAEAGLGQP
jgi:hypothetical protein